MQFSSIPIILDESQGEEQQKLGEYIYQQHIINTLKQQNYRLKSRISELELELNLQKQTTNYFTVKQEVLRISSFIKQAEEGRKIVSQKMQQEKQQLKTQLQMYKQKYSQAVSSNLRKIKTLDKNEALASKLQQDIKILKNDNKKYLQTIEQNKLQVSKLQNEKKRFQEQNIQLKKEKQIINLKLGRQQQKLNKHIMSLQGKIIQQDKQKQDLQKSIQQTQNELWGIKRIHQALKQKNQDLCVICYERPALLLNSKCGHLISCYDCSVELKQCPICREKQIQFIRLWRV